MLLRQLLQLGRVAAHQDRVGHQARAVLERHAALAPDREDRADQVLVHSHASGDPMHDDADASFAQCTLLIAFQSGIARLAKPGQSRLFVAMVPLAIFRRTAPWLRSYKSG